MEEDPMSSLKLLVTAIWLQVLSLLTVTMLLLQCVNGSKCIIKVLINNDVLKHKHSLITTMLDQAYGILSARVYFSQEFSWLENIFWKLMYSRKLFNLAVKQFIDSKVSDQQHSLSTETTTPSIRVISMIPFKDQASVNVLKKRFTDLSSKIKTTFQPVFISRKLNFV